MSAVLVIALLVWAREVLLPFVLALVIAYVLTPLVAACERIRIPRAAAILVVYVVTLNTLYLVLALIAPRIWTEAQKLIADTPAMTREVTTTWAPRAEAWVQGVLDKTYVAPTVPKPPPGPAIEVVRRDDGGFSVSIGAGVEVVQHGPGHWHVGPVVANQAKFSISDVVARGVDEGFRYVKANALDIIQFGKAVISKVARGVFLLFMTLMVAGYVMHTREAILGFFRSLVPATSRIGFDHLLWRIDRGLAGVVRGQLVICLVNGVVSAVGFAFFGLKYWPILAVVAAVMSIIPIFGSILSSIPVVLVGLTQGFWVALWVLLWIILIHQVEANLLNPKIIGVVAKIHPVLVVFALIIGEHFFGLWGALLAVPALSIAQSVFNHFRFESMPDAPPDSLVPAIRARSA
ncbi:MAG TPA: AI-2E family transporter [Polyangiaceae bacterium]|nr:AI-2E family transporter [Polyangiaceae bacterium]